MGQGQKSHGVRASKKAKYSAHKSGSSRKGKNRKQTGGTITLKNKALRAKKHQKLLSKQESRKELRLDLLKQVKAKNLNTKIGELSKKYGTLNIHRLNEILDNAAESSTWFKARIARKEANAQVQSTKVVRKHVKFRKRQKENMPEKIQNVHEG